MAIASVDARGVCSMGDPVTGGGSLLPATREPPKKAPIALGRTYAPMKVQPVGSFASSAAARVAPPPAPIAFQRPASPAGGSSYAAGPSAPSSVPFDASPVAYDPGAGYAVGQSPTAAGSSASSDASGESQRMTLAQAQASQPAPVGYYVAGGVAVLAVGLGLFMVTR